MSGLDLDVVANVGYLVVLSSLLMRDILWLRLLSVAAAFVFLPYYYFQPSPLWPPSAWNIIFTAVNVYWIIHLWMERRPVHFTPEEQRLYDKALRALCPCDARKLFQSAVWRTVPSGEQIVEQGHELDELSHISSGEFITEMDGMIVDEIGEGRFVGSYTFLKGKGSAAPVSFTAAATSRLVVWKNDALRDLIDDDTRLSMAVEASLGLELAHFLGHSRADLKVAQLLHEWRLPEAQAG
jgi:CRP-like cAMP-binding protein